MANVKIMNAHAQKQHPLQQSSISLSDYLSVPPQYPLYPSDYNLPHHPSVQDWYSLPS